MCGVATNVVCGSSFLYKLPLRGIRRFRHCFRRFGQQTNKKSDCNGENGDENSENRDQNGESVGCWGCGRDVGARRTQGFVPHSSASGCRERIISRGISTYPVHQKALHHKKGVGQSFRTGPHPAGEAAATATMVAVAAASLGIAYHQPVFWRPAATPETVQRIR